MNNLCKHILNLTLILTILAFQGNAAKAQPTDTKSATTVPTADVPATKSDQEIIEPCRTMIKNLGQDAITKLKGSKDNRKKREEQFQPIFLKNFGARKIGKFVLGSNYRKVTKEEFESFLKIFQRTIVSIYANRLGNYNDEKFVVKEGIIKLNNPTEKLVLVRSQVVSPKGNMINIDWKVAIDNGHQEIVDVIVEQVSQAMTQREEYMGIYRTGGIQGLIKQLEAKYAASTKG